MGDNSATRDYVQEKRLPKTTPLKTFKGRDTYQRPCKINKSRNNLNICLKIPKLPYIQ